MKLPVIAFAGLALVSLSACRTTPKFDYQDAYDRDLANCSVMTDMLKALDVGNREKAQGIALARVNFGLALMPDFAAKAHPAPWQKKDQTELAKYVLNYMYVHRAGFDLRWGLHVDSLRAALTEPEDLRRLAELENCLAKAKKKMEESNQNLMSAEDHQAKQSDEEISRKIVGTWIVDIDESPELSEKGTETFASDGSYVVKTTIIVNGKQREIQFEGTWEIKDGYLMGTNLTHDTNQILRVDDDELVSLMDGKLSTLRRKK
jgi:hypothetical protein